MNNPDISCLFTPLEMPNLKLKNRFLMAPMGTGFSIEKTKHFLAARAAGDVALITTGETSVHPSGRTAITNELLIETDNDIKPMSEIAGHVKKNGAHIVLQLNHAGRYSPGRSVGGRAVAPSPIMSGYTGETPRELTTTEADDLVTAFAQAALRAKKAGYSGVEFLGSSGYLISEFLSPLTNKRSDKYGGNLEQRCLFLTSIITESRKLVGNDFNLCVKFDADDGMNGGVTLEESRIMAPLFEKAGADRLNIWAGWHESTRPMLPMTVEHGAFTYLSAEIKKTVSIPVSIAGRINDPETASKIIMSGEADIIGVARALLSDPDFVKKAKEGKATEIRKCTACCHCFDKIISATKRGQDTELFCSMNAELGREGENLIKPAQHSRNIAVIGAGPAGLEAARVAAMRGHKVTIYEADNRIGGMVNLSVVPPHKDELKSIPEYYSRQIELLKINLKLNTKFNPAGPDNDQFDAVIVATGAKSKIPDIPGIRETQYKTAIEILRTGNAPGDSILIIGGGMVGLETAEYLADMGKKVTVVEMDKIAADIGPTTRWGFISRIRRKVKIMSMTAVANISGNTSTLLEKETIKSKVQADLIIIASGMESDRILIDEFNRNGIEYYTAGSCRNPGLIDDAIHEGFEIGCNI
ncbi:MAG: FAD-dependent oxidoreductase [Spirochaetes bacterium]|nr:FAD-dependent oxidoreductase [Spirochaetota bacterium]